MILMTMMTTATTSLWLFVWWMLAASRGCEGWLGTSSASHSAPPSRMLRHWGFLPPPTILQGLSTSTKTTTTTMAAAKVFYDPSTVSQTELDKKVAVAIQQSSSARSWSSGTTSTKSNKNSSTEASTTTTHKINSNVNNINNLQAVDKLAQVTASNPDVLDSDSDCDSSIPHPAGVPETAAPPLSYQKFLTKQEKRAVVQIRYSSDAGLKPYFLTVAKKLKTSHPDVIIERRILPKTPDSSSSEQEPTFEIWVDGKVVVGRTGKGRPRSKSSSRHQGVLDLQKGRSIFVSMNELDLAIGRARRKARPASTVYGDTVAGSTTTTTTTQTKNGADKNKT